MSRLVRYRDERSVLQLQREHGLFPHLFTHRARTRKEGRKEGREGGRREGVPSLLWLVLHMLENCFEMPLRLSSWRL